MKSKGLVAILIASLFIVGCSNQSNELKEMEQLNAEQAATIDALKSEIEEISMEKEELQSKMKEGNSSDEIDGESGKLEESIDDDYRMMTAKSIDQYPESLYKTMTLAIDEDGTEVTVELYVEAGKSDSGAYAWDDGQSWLLLVKDGEETYPLFDDYIQLGSLNFTKAVYDDKPSIVMFKTTHANKEVHKFTFESDEMGFQKELIYRKDNMNDHYNKATSIAFFKEAYELMEAAFTKQIKGILDASDAELENREERMTMTSPLINDVSNVNQLLDLVGELDKKIHLSLDGILNILYAVEANPPTAMQKNDLKLIYETFENLNKIDVMENPEKINPTLLEEIQQLTTVMNDNYQ